MDVLSKALRALTPLLLALAVAGCPKAPPRPPTEEGAPPVESPFPEKPKVEARRNPEADAALERARAQAEAQPNKARAAEAFLAVRKAYPGTTAGQDALYQAGVLYYDARDWQAARRAFNELLFENPLHPQAEDAKRRLGYAALEAGAPRDAYQTLASLAERAEGPERTRLLEGALAAAEQAGLFKTALALAVQLAGEAPPEGRDVAVARVTRLVETRADFKDIAELADGLPQGHPAWPVLTFKLARIYYHLRDWAQLEATLNRYLGAQPQGPYAQQAREMLARATRRSEVSPRKVGLLLPLSGRYKPIGEAVLRGVQLALQGSPVELVVKDTQGDANAAGLAVESLVYDEGVVALIGPLTADDSTRAALVAGELAVPIVTLTREQASITDLGPWVFHHMFTNAAQARVIADYAMRVMGMKRFAVVYPNTEYGTGLSNSFWDEVLQRGGTIRGAETYGYDQTTFSAEAKKLVGRYYLEDRLDYVEAVAKLGETKGLDSFRRRKALERIKSTLDPVVDFDGIFMPDSWTRVSLVAPALAVEDIVTNACDPKDLERIRKTTGKDVRAVTLFGAQGWSSPKGTSGLPQLLERGGKFVVCSIYADAFFVDSERPATKRFVDAFRKRYSADPGLLEAYGFDTARMVRSVIEQQKPQTREALRDALGATKNYEGATGRTTFDERRQAQKQMFLLQVTSKGLVELNPEKAPEGS